MVLNAYKWLKRCMVAYCSGLHNKTYVNGVIRASGFDEEEIRRILSAMPPGIRDHERFHELARDYKIGDAK